MDATAPGYAGAGMKKLISKKLYDPISATDVIRELFLGPTGEAYGLKDLYSSLNSVLEGSFG